MRLSNATLLALLSASVLVDAAPAPASASENTVTVSKRETLIKAVADFEELKLVRAKRSDLETELTTREYAIVTQVLTAIKDTELTPKILKFFVSNDVLKNAAITGVEYVIRSGLLSLKNLLSLLVQSGLITDVLNDVLGNCEVYASIINVAKGLLSSLFKREDLSLDFGVEYDGDLIALKRDVVSMASEKRSVPYSHDEGFEMLKRDGMVENPELLRLLEAVKRENMDEGLKAGHHERSARDLDLSARDVDDVVINVLESLAASGLASQVVETVLTDSDFVTFAGALVKKLYQDGLVSVSGLVSAVSQSGLLPALIKELANFSTLSKIATTALAAFDGECSSAVNTNTTSTGSTSSSGSSLLGTLISSLTDGSDDSTDSGAQDAGSGAKDTGSTGTTTAATTTDSSSDSGSGSGILGLVSSLLGGGSLLSGLLSGTDSSAPDACSTSGALLKRERMRLY